MYCYQNAGQNHNVRIANRLFENVAKFEFLLVTVTDREFSEQLSYSPFFRKDSP
jgi:hypothetical protein